MSKPITGPSVELLNRYLNGETTESEQKWVETQLEEDPMLADALEGLANVSDHSRVNQSVKRIQAASRKRLFAQTDRDRRESLSKRKSRVQVSEHFSMFFVATAAAIALLFATVFVIRDIGFPENPQTAVAQNSDSDETPSLITEETSPAIIPPAVADSARPTASARSSVLQPATPPPAEKESFTALATTPAVSPPLTIAAVPGKDDSPEDIVNIETTRRQEKISTEIPITSGLTLLRDSMGEYANEKQVSSIPLKQAVAEDAPAVASSVTTGTVELSESDETGKFLKGIAMADLLTQAIAHHDRREYNAAKERLAEVLQSEPQNRVAQYYLASTLHHLGYYSESIKEVKPLLRNSLSPLFEDAQWLLAQNYSRNGRKNAALKLLAEIEAAGGKYQEQARNLRMSYGENQ